MQTFEYANPATLHEALKLLGFQWGEADVLAGGTDQISLMKDFIHTPKRVVNIKAVKELGGIHHSAQGLRIGATVTFDELASNAAIRTEYPSLHAAVMGVSSRRFATWGPRAAICASARAAGITGKVLGSWHCGMARAWCRTATIGITPSSAEDGRTS